MRHDPSKPERWLRRKDGVIFGWNEWLAAEPGMVEATEQEAYPERFVKGGKRAAKVDLSVDAPEPEPDPSEVNLLSGSQAGKQVEAKHGFGADPKPGTGKGFHK